MIEKLKESWRQLRRSEPGHRFQEHHRRRRETAESPLRRGLWVGAGVVLFAVGVFFLAVPGPGIPPLLLGAGLIAREWLLAARLLDRAEVGVRRVLSWSLRTWKRSPVWGKGMIVLAAVIAAGALAFFAYEIALGG
jgi:hypothetical protein